MAVHQERRYSKKLRKQTASLKKHVRPRASSHTRTHEHAKPGAGTGIVHALLARLQLMVVMLRLLSS